MKLSTKEYIDNQFEWLHKLREADNRAVEKYSDTNDEWKDTHNNLLRQNADDRREDAEDKKNYLSKAEFGQFVKMFWALLVLLSSILIAIYFKK